ncbi:MAG: hypothetical protein ACMUIG_06075 [Thermoplasmatota archaeon]
MGRTTVFRSPVDRGKIRSKLILLGGLILFLLIPFDAVFINGLDGRSRIMGIDSTLFIIVMDAAILIIPLLIFGFRIKKETDYYSNDRIEVSKGSVRIINNIPKSMRTWESMIRRDDIISVSRCVPDTTIHRFTSIGDEGLSALPGRSIEKFTHPYYHDRGLVELRLDSRTEFTRWDVFRVKKGYEKIRKPLNSQKENPPIELDRLIISMEPSDVDRFAGALGWIKLDSGSSSNEDDYSSQPSISDIYRFNVKQIAFLFLLYLIPLVLLLAYTFASPSVSASAEFRRNVIFAASIGSVLLIPLILFLSFIEIPSLRRNWNIGDQSVTCEDGCIKASFTFTNSIGGKEIIGTVIPGNLIRGVSMIPKGTGSGRISPGDRILFPLKGMPPGTLYNPIVRSQDILRIELNQKIEAANYLPRANIARKMPDTHRTDAVALGIDPAFKGDLPGILRKKSKKTKEGRAHRKRVV